MTAQVWGKLAVAFALAAIAIVVVPKLGTGDDQPGIGTLLTAGGVVALLTTGALYVVLRSDLGLPASIALFAVGYTRRFQTGSRTLPRVRLGDPRARSSYVAATSVKASPTPTSTA